jgi:NADPH2:quinone reductase
VDGAVDAAVLGVGAQESVRDRGVDAHVVAGPPPPPLRAITVHPTFAHGSRAVLSELEAGVISTRVAGTYPLDDAVTAYKRLAGGGIRGRLVLTP